MVSEAPCPPSDPSAAPLDDEALCALALRDGLPTLGLSLDDLLRRTRSEKTVA